MALLALFRRTSVAFGVLVAGVLAGVPSAMAQTNPTAQGVPYSQSFSSLTPATVTALPVGWVGWVAAGAAAPTYPTTAPTADRPLTASGSASSNAGNTYNYLDKPGYLNSGSINATLAVAINTTALQNIVVGYDVMTIRNPFDGTTNTKIQLTTIQYRVGTTGGFTTLDAASYFNNTVTQTGAGVTTPQNLQNRSITLPAACNNQSVVQLRWVSRDSTGGGGRPSTAIDNVSVTGSTLTYTITATAGANGSVTPAGSTIVNSGASQGYTITPNTGYHVADVLVDGASVGAVTSFNFTNVTANHTISATFAINTFTLTASAGSNGSIAPPGVTTVNYGGGQSYTITPNAGYVVQDVLVDGATVGAVTNFNFTNVTASHTLSATFVVDPSIAVVNAVSPGTFVTTVANATVPVTLTRGLTTPILGYSVTVQLTGLTATPAAFTQGGFLSASGANTNLQVVDNGGGSYTIDGVTLGVPCGSSATSGTLFSVSVGSTLLGGSGTVTITSVTLRDCSNGPLASSIGTAATVPVDRSTPSVAVTSPNGGESWLTGSVHPITWTATDPEGIAANSITLEYSVDNGSSWLPVASALANSGTFAWTVPNNPSPVALVRASAVDIHANSGNDASDAPFTIQGTTSTSVASAPNPSVFGESVTITATVTPGVAAGTVEFFDGVTSLGSAPLVSGSASINSSALAVGLHALTAVYGGSVLYAGSTSAAHSHTVNPAGSSTAVTSSPNPSVVGEGVTLTATVTPATASGTVEFFDGAASLGTAPVSGGSASIGTSSLGVGGHSLTAFYSGDTNYSASTSPAHAHTVDPAGTTTALTSVPNPSSFAQSVTLTATVSVNPPGAGSPSGTVEFFDGAASLGTSPVASGSSVLNTSSLAVGPHSLTAVYLGDASFTGSTSAVHSHAVGTAGTSTVVVTTPNPSVVGESVTITATVSPSLATGSVEFFEGASSLGSSPLVSGVATLNTSGLAVGSHSLTAVYGGDLTYSASTSPVHGHTVNQATTSTALASAPNPSQFGHDVTLTATVAVDPPGAGSPGGTVEFFDGSTSVGTSPLVSGLAVFNTSTLSTGPHTLTAHYSGDVSFAGSTSAGHSHTVNSNASSVTLVAAPDPATFLDPVTLTATVSPASATGSVEFFDGASSLGSSPVSAGSAQLATSALSVGVHSLTAHYSGDTSFDPSTSAPYSLEVKAKIVATASANGNLSPSGTTLYSLNATPSYTFSADAGYHVSAVTVDGGPAPLTSPYTFAPVSSNHTIDVQFAANPAVAAISNLVATQVRTGNDGDGNTKITLTWSGVSAGSTVEVWRKAYGNYPEYDDGPTPGSVPGAPGTYPPAGWTLTTVTVSGATDEPGSRDFWYYVAYVTDPLNTRSPVSNRSNGALSYHLGDVSDGSTPGLGDNVVTTSDLSVLGSHYGITGSAVDAVNYLDVGPTTNLAVTSRPMTDNKVDFEDLVMFAINYFPVASMPPLTSVQAPAPQDALALTAPTAVLVGQDVAVRISFTGTGNVLAMSAQLAWDPAVVQPVSFTAGDEVLEEGALLFSAAPGSVDGAVFTGTGQGFLGQGEFATIHFHVTAAGDPHFGFASTDARSNQNHSVALATGVTAVTPSSFATAFAPAMPNPFGRSTTFLFSLAKAGPAELEMFSVDGRRVRTISNGVREAGEYRLQWNGSDDNGRPVAAGVYYARLVTAQGRFTRVVTRLD